MENIYIMKEKLNERISKHFNKDLISVDDLLNIIDELDFEIEMLNEKIEEIEQDKKDNWSRQSISSQVGINNNDFI